jgi:uncharacterized protein YebE (UPF0316 family)
MTAIGTALLIFLLRIIDVPIGTVRVIYTVRGYRTMAMILGFIESLVWIFAISRLMKVVNENPVNMVAWAVGFAAGTVLGISLEKWIATGQVMIRIISIYHSGELRTRLLGMDFGVTAVQGEGKDGSVLILFVVATRRRGRLVLETVEQIDPDAFVTVEPLSQAVGGYFPVTTSPFSLRK